MRLLHRPEPAPEHGRAGLGLRLAVAAALAALALASSGCVAYGGSTTAARVQSWVKSQSFVSNTDTLVDDVARAHEAASHGTSLQLRTVCSGFEADTGIAYDMLPAPSSELTTTLNAADQDFFKAALQFATAASVSLPAVSASFAKMAEGVADLHKASSELGRFGVSWVPHR